jgi:hypothetical protein
MSKNAFWLAALLSGIMLPNSALAYIGPGAGLSAVGTVVAVIGAILLLIVGFIWYPIKRVLRGWKEKKNTARIQPIDRKS